MSALGFLHFLAGVVVLAEALNKAQRCDPLAPGLGLRERVCEVLKAIAWALMALGAGGAMVTPVLLALGAPQAHALPMMRLEHPTLAETAVLTGFAVLIVRTRVKEG